MDDSDDKTAALNPMAPLVLVGGGGHARVSITILRKLARFRILGYTAIENSGDLLGVPFVGSDTEIARLANEERNLSAVLAVGQVGLGNLRCSIWERLHVLPISFPPIISPNAIVNECVSIAEGAMVMDGAVVNTGADIGRGAIVNTNSTIEHDVVLGDWVHVAPGATVCGGVTVGTFSMIGTGATIIEGRTIRSGCHIGAGATVVHDLYEPGVYVGCPARRIGS
jgi:sugar O-acyltransferase (sialic acid O-acetyltransferase NeuD family)